MEKFRESHHSANDWVPREELWFCIRKSGVTEKYVSAVQDMYVDRKIVSVHEK